jgi:carbon storage regulator
MWVFSRKKNEQLVIHDNIFVTVIEIRGDKVRLGIEHPKEVPVHRQEVYDAIRRLDSPTATPASPPPEPPPAHFPDRTPDKLDQFAAALEARLSVPVKRDVVLQAMREAGLEELARQSVAK